MHDLVDYEARGIPTVMVASSEFVSAAELQSNALGMPDIAARAVYVPHPIQDATDDEMRAKARAAFDAILGAVTT
ncbi:MAG: hypothetical protein F4Y45_07790 [Acidobacteria bacterium]|nr:hypothetical protein [Acidobacteriota bacterium]MXZ70337.1 hypothetical protein [Acidobacteriota bacterium]MYD69647.1 hypothetical protein [Acidobacteriota bacterium]MYJ03523.1 hypothetical protein [Acidobacteriota bacterium]